MVLLIAVIACSGIETDEQQEPTDEFEPEIVISPHERSDFFIAVHCEPGPSPISTKYVETNWPALTRMVQSATDHHMHLTLLLNPQWAMYILEDPTRKELIWEWEAYGHEIGLHHHGPHMQNWNGYTNQKSYFESGKYVGRVDEMMVLINMVPQSRQIKTACVNDQDSQYDFPPGVPYETHGGADKLEDLWSIPATVSRNGQDVLQVTHARYAARGSSVNIDLQEMSRILAGDEPTEITGVVFHAFEYADNPVPFDSLFSLLDENQIYTRSVSAILDKSL